MGFANILQEIRKNSLYDYRYPGTNGGLNVIEFNILMSNCTKLYKMKYYYEHGNIYVYVRRYTVYYIVYIPCFFISQKIKYFIK